jgi:hypothetical protein
MTIGGSLFLIAMVVGAIGFALGLVFLARRPAGPPPV